MDNLKIVNEKEIDKWCFNHCVNLGHTIRFIKGKTDGYDGEINIGAECVETGEFLPIIYEELNNSPK